MATLPRSAVDAYTEQLDALSDAAREAVAAMLVQVEYEDVADLRERVIEIMEAVCGASSDMAAAYAAEFYDEARLLAVGAAIGAAADPVRDPRATEGAVRALVQKVVDGRPFAEFVSALQGRADYEVKRAAGECVKANAASDPMEVRWARVPGGAETCPFCIMLASRGFAYKSERTASEKKGGGHYHENCRCRIVPGFPGMEIEGYDPDALYGQYVSDLRSGRLKPGRATDASRVRNWSSDRFESYGDIASYIDSAFDVEDLQARCAVVAEQWDSTELSDRYWRMAAQRAQFRRAEMESRGSTAGARAVADFLGDGRSGVAHVETREVQPHEFRAYAALMASGRDIKVKAVSQRARNAGKASPDLEMGGHRYELKCPDGSNEKKTIGRNINKAVAQMRNADPPASGVRIVLSALETPLSRENVEYHVRRKMDEGGIDEIVVIFKGGAVSTYKK